VKPHRLADLANALTAVATQYGHQEQCRERILSVLVDHFAPEHGNRGPELETAVLVDARELEALREMARAGDALCEKLYEYAEGNLVFPELQRCDKAKAALRSTTGGT
jgi:hypothetical protein